jgi:tetratricopeptide (TPR) repeat protein
MLSIFYAVAVLLALLALPYLIGIWNLRHTTMRCMKITPANPKDIPEHLKAFFKAAIDELKQFGFKPVSCQQIEFGPEKDGKRWGILLQHSSGQTYAGLMSNQLIDSANLLIRTFITEFDDGTRLTTTNTPNYEIYSPNPQETVLNLGPGAVAPQWQAHQEKLADLSQTKQIQTLPVNAFIETLEAREQAGMERLANTGEISWVKPGESYRTSWWTAVRTLYGVLRNRKANLPGAGSQQAIAAPTSASTTPIVELEIEEFNRLQQKQQNGLSQRGKNWLLLGTLALFIASYSSVFEPQRLLIFVAVLLLHEGGHVLAMKIFGYRNTMMLFIPFLGALATARKDNASLTEKVWISLAGPLPGLALGIGLAIAFSIPDWADPSAVVSAATWFEETNWIRETSWMLIILNLFNLLPIYPLDGGQVADLLLFSRNPYIGVMFKGIGVLLLGLLGFVQPLMLVFALLIALTIPTSFRLAKLNIRFRKNLRTIPHSDRNETLKFLFTQLQEPLYQSLPFAKKYSLVVGLLDTRQEDSAKWHVRAGLSGIYLVSLLSGLAGGLYAVMPNWAAWTATLSGLIDPLGAYRHRMQQELDAANQALLANPNNVDAYLKRGRARIAFDDYEGAIADANQILQINPNSGEAYHLRGLARRQTGDITGATADQEKGTELLSQQRLETLNQQLKQNPNDADAYVGRANLYYALKRYPDAIADSNRALLIDPQNIWAVLQRGEAYLALNKYPEALGNANHALRLDPNSGDAYEFRSRVRHHMGDAAGAIADEQKADTLFQAQENSDL